MAGSSVTECMAMLDPVFSSSCPAQMPFPENCLRLPSHTHTHCPSHTQLVSPHPVLILSHIASSFYRMITGRVKAGMIVCMQEEQTEEDEVWEVELRQGVCECVCVWCTADEVCGKGKGQGVGGTGEHGRCVERQLLCFSCKRKFFTMLPVLPQPHALPAMPAH